MFINLCRLAAVCTLCICAETLQYPAHRLVIGDGGYARLLKPAPSLTEITIAAWVNITQFPYGVAPILTAVSPDATNQVAFFLRHDGLGVLWGGPPPSSPRYQLDQVDRHPRTQWTPMGAVQQKRRRRDAVDYSGGLGDIENIMADSRSGRSFDTWTPHSFVDVDTMGVADLEASPSGLNDDLHLLPTRDGFSRSESYNDWTVVPYELTMQESDPYDSHLGGPEPRIITEPSGDDDFVLFNWNVPAPPKPSIPQSPNEWSPMWHSDEEIPRVPEREVQQSTERITLSDNNPGWSSQVTEVRLGPNHWNPYRIRGAAFTTSKPPQEQPTTPRPRPPTTIQPQTTTQRRTTPWPTRRTTGTWPIASKPKTTRPSIPIITTPRSGLRWRTSKRPATTTTAPTTVTQKTIHVFNPTSLGIPKNTTTKRPHTREPSIPRQTSSSTRQSTRMPLWKLIKQPNPSHSSTAKTVSTSTTAASTTRPTTTTITSTSTTTSTTTTQRPTTTKSFSRKNLPHTLSSRYTTTRPRPTSNVYFTPGSRTTDKPHVSGQKSKVTIWSSSEDIFKQQKEQSHSNKWVNKSQGSSNAVNKHRSVQITDDHVQEFQRAMEGLPTVKDGNTAIVYSVPITDVEAFNTMYQHYQKQFAPEPLPTTRAPPVIKEAILVAVHEDETNGNQLGENNLHLQDRFSYGFPNEPEATFEETAAPALLTEEEAVLIPTEEPLPPTPSRSDIPITDDIQPIPNSGKLFGATTKQPLPRETPQDLNKKEQPIVIIAVEENTEEIQEPEVISVAPHTVKQSTPKSAPTTSVEPEVKDSAEQTTSQPENTETPIRNKPTHAPTTTTEEIFSSVSAYSDEPLQTKPAVSTIQENTNQSTTMKLQTTALPTTASPTTAPPTTTTPSTAPVRSALVTTNAHAKPPAKAVTESDVSLPESKLESNNFAVFHITEDDIPYFPEQEEPADVFSVDELYRPEGILVTQEDIHPVSHYQEPSHLYHQQLPPEYKYESAPRPIAYGGPISQAAETITEKSDDDDLMFSADPQQLIEQGFLPQPVHYVSTQEEADQWMQAQYKKTPQIEERVFEVESDDSVNAGPAVPVPPKENNSQASGNFHFRKLPYDFLENQWYHLVFTWSSSDHQVGVYIDGELAGTLNDVLPANLVLEGGGLTILGQTLLPDLTDFDPTSQFIGELSDVNMWGQRLGSEAIKGLYNCKAQIPVSPVLEWQQLSMRFYSDVQIQENIPLCGA